MSTSQCRRQRRSSDWSHKSRASTAPSTRRSWTQISTVFSEWECEFFDLHITSDEVHGERGYQIVLKYADTPELQQRCIAAVREAADMRFFYTKMLYETYVKPDLGEWVEEPIPSLA